MAAKIRAQYRLSHIRVRVSDMRTRELYEKKDRQEHKLGRSDTG